MGCAMGPASSANWRVRKTLTSSIRFTVAEVINDLGDKILAIGNVLVMLIHQPHQIARHRQAGRAIDHIAWAVGEKNVQHLGRADAVKDVGAVARLPAGRAQISIDANNKATVQVRWSDNRDGNVLTVAVETLL